VGGKTMGKGQWMSGLIAVIGVVGIYTLKWLLRLDVIYRVCLLLFAIAVIKLVKHNNHSGRH